MLSHAPRPRSLVPLLAAVLCCCAAQAATVDRIVAVVNEDIITDAELSAHARAFLAEVPPPVSDAQAKDARQAMLRRLIEERLMLQEARRLALTASTDEIEEQMAGIRGRFSSEEEFQASLAESGITMEQFRQRLRDQIMTKKAIDDQVRARITISPQEVLHEMDLHPELRATGPRVKLRHLLVRAGEPRSEGEARDLATRLARQIRDGASFAELARQHSEDTHAAEGGNMGWVAVGQLRPELDGALAGLAPGQVSEPIKTALGYHLLLVESRKDAADLPPQDANNAVYRAIYERKIQAEMQGWIDRLLKDAYIEVAKDA